ncbi:MAG: phosphonate ABC transporter, permease protein PhnE [Desulfocurvibacter africanus]
MEQIVSRTDITLQDVTPRTGLRQKLALGALLAIILATLTASWISTGIEPLALYNKRQNAFDYLFGRQLSEADKERAMQQASRLPAIILLQQTEHELRQKYQAQGRQVDPMSLHREAQALANEQLEKMDPAEREAIVSREYERIADERKGGYFPPETHASNLMRYTKAIIETVAIAIWGTLFAFMAAIPVSMFAARNTLQLMISGESPGARAARWFSHFAVRRFLDFCRGFNEFVMALIFVAVIGLGPFAGVMALAIHTFGILGKVFSEAIEAIEPGQVEAVEASGARPAQIMAFSVLPQIMPLVVSYSLLRFESNVRSATILGFVGAGGIGFLMFDKINGYLYREVCTMMIMVIACVTIIDYLCGLLRKQFT